MTACASNVGAAHSCSCTQAVDSSSLSPARRAETLKRTRALRSLESRFLLATQATVQQKIHSSADASLNAYQGGTHETMLVSGVGHRWKLCKRHLQTLSSLNMLTPGHPIRLLLVRLSATCRIHGQVLRLPCRHVSCAATFARQGRFLLVLTASVLHA
jgi:hypothetical protein